MDRRARLAGMPHRSRLTAVLVDVPTDDHARAVEFWSGAFGTPGERSEKFPEYVDFGQVTPGMEFMVQATGDSGPRVHLDIETDDVEAEVARLIGLCAREIERHHSWVVMRDPVGTTFCVVRVQIRDAFEQHAIRWD
jgi:predicted enzyme related to lactoylglutathione lyase